MKKTFLFLNLSLVIALVNFTSCTGSRGETPSATPTPTTTITKPTLDSAAIAKSAVANYVKTEQRKKHSSDSVAIALGLKDLGLSELHAFDEAVLNPDQIINEKTLGGYEINYFRWDIRQTFGLDDAGSELLVSEAVRNPDAIANVLNNNTNIIRNVLRVSGLLTTARVMYEKEKVWMLDKNPSKAALFEGFFQKYGKLASFPSTDEKNESTDPFWIDMNKIIASDPSFFKNEVQSLVPNSYKEWLFVKRWQNKMGKINVIKIAAALEVVLYK